MKRVGVCLGAYGDIINIAPLLWKWHQDGDEISLIVSMSYKDLLDGFSYVKSLPYPGHYSEPVKAVSYAKKVHSLGEVIPLQCYGWPFVSRTDSFCKDAYNISGNLAEFRKHPLIFDRRDPVREKALIDTYVSGQPLILVSTVGKSSPFMQGKALLSGLQHAFGRDHQIMALDCIRADRFYDLLGLFDMAKVLVTIDTGHAHLARASKVPVINLVVNTPTPWHGMVPTENSILFMRYHQFDLRRILQAIEAL